MTGCVPVCTLPAENMHQISQYLVTLHGCGQQNVDSDRLSLRTIAAVELQRHASWARSSKDRLVRGSIQQVPSDTTWDGTASSYYPTMKQQRARWIWQPLPARCICQRQERMGPTNVGRQAVNSRYVSVVSECPGQRDGLRKPEVHTIIGAPEPPS